MIHQLRVRVRTVQERILSRTNSQINIEIENLGSAPFPGGQIPALIVKFQNMDNVRNDPIIIPEIKPQSTLNLGPYNFWASEAGLAWFEVNVVSNDEEEVRLFNGTKEQKPWRDTLFIFRYEEMQIISILNEISSKLDALLEQKENN